MRRSGATQTSDRLPLDSCLAVMRRLGSASEDYVTGYEHGFTNRAPVSISKPYLRGRRAGHDAYWRGAHGADPSGGTKAEGQP